MIAFLEDQGIQNPQRYSKPELEALIQEILVPTGSVRGPRKDPCLGLSSLTKPDLRELASLLGIPNFEKMTNGILMVNIRHTVEELMDQNVGFGRLKTVSMKNAALGNAEYCAWAATQLSGNPHSRLKQLVALHRMYFRFYPRPREQTKATAAAAEQQPEVWPQEPEEERKPERRTTVAASAASGSGDPQPKRAAHPPQAFKIDSEEEGAISDSPPAWEEKKAKQAEPTGVKRK